MLIRYTIPILFILIFGNIEAASHGLSSFCERGSLFQSLVKCSRGFSMSRANILHKDYHTTCFAVKYNFPKFQQEEENSFLGSDLNFSTFKTILLNPLDSLPSMSRVPSGVNEVAIKYFGDFSKMYHHFIYGGYHSAVFGLLGRINYIKQTSRFHKIKFSLPDLLPKDDALLDLSESYEKLKLYRKIYAEGKDTISNIEYLLLKKKVSILASLLDEEETAGILGDVSSEESGHIDIFSDHEIHSFLQDLSSKLGKFKREFILMPAVNGVRIKVLYEKGLFDRATIMMLNNEELDATDIVRELQAVPLCISEKRKTTIFGCFTLHCRVLSSLNKERRSKGQKVWPDTHTAIMSSILYSPEPNKVLDMRLRCLFHGVTIVGKKFSSISEQLKYLREKEFTVLRPEFVKLCTSENLSYTLELMSKMEFPFERSSIFASNDDLREAKIFNLKGFNYRSIHDFKKTVVDKVEFKVLPNGIVIAVVHVDPVMINGHTFNYFTINNEQQLNQINMRLGDELIVYAEENMPPKVLFSYKNGAKAPVKFPKHCSKCKSPLKKVSLSGEDVLMCISHLSCVDESADKIRKFTSAHGLYVPSLTSSIIRDLVDNNLISNAADLLDLFEKGYGEVTFMEKNEYNRISTEIKEAKKCRLENFIYGIAIPNVNFAIAQALVYKFGSLNYIRRLSFYDLSEFDSKVARSIVDYFLSEEHQSVINKLLSFGLEIFEPKKEIVDICTRLPDKYTRSEYAIIIEKLEYNEKRHEISDFEYDLLDKKAKEIEQINPGWFIPRKDSFSRDVESWVDPIVELNKTYRMCDVRAFFDKHSKDGCIVEPKVNGVGCSLVYNNGVLSSTYTKRNKLSSFNLFSLLRRVDQIPKILTSKFSGVVRGELYISDDDIRTFEQQQRRENSTIFVDTLTALTSFLRGYSSAENLGEFVRFFPFHVTFNEEYAEKPELANQIELHSYFKKLGFDAIAKEDFKVFHIPQALVKYVTNPEKRRQDFNVAIDGMVVKPYNVSQHAVVRKDWCIGYKFMPETLTSRVTAIKYIKHNNGMISAIISIEPTLFSNGRKVTNISVQNMSKLATLGIGSRVSIGYIGGVVPRLEEVIVDTSQSAFLVGIPTKCPECNHLLKQVSEYGLKCENVLCVGTASTSAILHFAEQMKISSPERIKDLIAGGVIYDISSFYKLIPEQTLVYWDSSVSSDFFSDIERSKNVNLSTFIHALNIPLVGRRTALSLAKKLTRGVELISVNENELLRYGFHKNIAKSIVKYMEENVQVMLSLAENVFPSDEEAILVSSESDKIEAINLEFFINEFMNKRKTMHIILEQTIESLRDSVMDHKNLLVNLNHLTVDDEDLPRKKNLESKIKKELSMKMKYLRLLEKLSASKEPRAIA